jgi:predicted phosphatase
MNVSLQNATVQGNDDQHYHFEEFFVKARNIRYVQIPEDVSQFHEMNHLTTLLLSDWFL